MSEDDTEGSGIDDKIESNFTELMDLQHKIVMHSRDMAQRALLLAETFELQAERAREIADLHEQGTQMAAKIFGDIIVAEQGFEVSEEEEDDG